MFGQGAEGRGHAGHRMGEGSPRGQLGGLVLACFYSALSGSHLGDQRQKCKENSNRIYLPTLLNLATSEVLNLENFAKDWDLPN